MEKINNILRSYDEKIVLKDKQREALLYLAQKKGDLIVNLPVGYGKSILYHVLPQILGENTTKHVVLVISPLNVIQKDQRLLLKEHSITCCRLDITANIDEDHGCVYDDEQGEEEHDVTYTVQSDVSMDHLKRGDFSIVLCHTEALPHLKKGSDILKSEIQQHVVAVVIDECHILEKWGEEFRTAFKELKTLKAFFPGVPFVALSGTLTTDQKKMLPKQLGLSSYHIIECSPDRQNIFLEKFDKGKTADVETEYEEVTHGICDKLFKDREKFPVTLLFIPVHYMSHALMYLNSLFKPKNIDDAMYSAICSGQDQYVIDKTLQELKKPEPHIRLILTTSFLGMGFDPENVTHVVHVCPQRNVSQYFQEIGRAGRRGQPSTATLYYSSRNIAKNLPCINNDIISYCKNTTSCIRNQLLSVFGFQKDDSLEGCKCCSYCREYCTCHECFQLNISM